EDLVRPAVKRRLGLALRVLAVAVVIVACAFFARGLDWRGLGRALARASLPLVALAAALNLLIVWWRSARLGALLAPVRVVRATHLFRYHLASFAANNLLPGRAGELLRIVLLRRREGVPAASALALALVAKVVDP